jgi:hypothetical protein
MGLSVLVAMPDAALRFGIEALSPVLAIRAQAGVPLVIVYNFKQALKIALYCG